MKDNQKDLLVLEKTSKELTLSKKHTGNKKKKTRPEEPEIEGSLLTIEKPIEHNKTTILSTEEQIEDAVQGNKSSNTEEKTEKI